MENTTPELSAIAAACTDTGADTGADDARTFAHSATYSPEDNKLRIYPAHRLAREDYERVKAAGFSWAPRQEIFVAPMWTPAREDLARELCGEIGDEDTSLSERAEARADRFEDYSDRRADDAAAARDAVARIADGIPMGQPILIGHHSERHARKDAERIENGMRRAVRMWETSEYWTRRAAGAILAAKYKERPDVRARRIKGIESDVRKLERTGQEVAARLAAWRIVDEACRTRPADVAHALALHVANGSGYDSQCFPLADYPRDPPASQYEGPMGLWSALDGGVITAAQAVAIALRRYAEDSPSAQHRARWAAHYAGRLAYERAMLAEETGADSEGARMAAGLSAGWDLQPGGFVTHRGRRSVIVRVNRKDGAPISLTVTGQGWTVGIEEVTAYEPPTAEAAAAVQKATKLAPLCNYDGAGFARMTEAEYSALYEGARCIRPMPKTDTHERHRVRHISGHLSAKHGGPVRAGYDLVPVFLTDAKVKPAPTIGGDPSKPARRSMARKVAEAAGVDTGADLLAADPGAPAAADPAPAPTAPAVTLRDLVREANEPTAADLAEALRLAEARKVREAEAAAGAEFAAMAEALRTGVAVQVVAAPQLFPTPAHVAARMVDLAEIKPGARILEPSAGTGAILQAVRTAGAFLSSVVWAVEVVPALADRLRAAYPGAIVAPRDFLTIDPATWAADRFDVVLINPPFANAADVAYVMHARRFLAPGGRIVGICAAGPRQHAALQPLADSWEYLEAGTFEGTNVRAVLFTMGAAD